MNERLPSLCGMPIVFTEDVSPPAGEVVFGDFSEFIVPEVIPAPQEYELDERL